MATAMIGLTVAFVVWSARSLNRVHAELVASHACLAQLATEDSLTGLPNRRPFDAHGHDAGDGVLRRIGAVLRRELRAHDTPARLGGEELTILMPETPVKGAHIVAERVREAIAAETFSTAGGLVYGVTCGIGVAELERGPEDGPALLMRTDRAMYAAKQAGRNRVTLAGPYVGAPSGVAGASAPLSR